jgi:hypothetical protein
MLVQAADATKLTGLSSNQLREWCGRREILEPDIAPSGPGRHALYGWQTLLVLRVLLVLQEEFGVEVVAWAKAARRFRKLVDKRSFPSLTTAWVFFADCNQAVLLESIKRGSRVDAGLLLPLKPHLDVLATAFASQGDSQMQLLRPMAVTR